jgi:hypothetical protein
MSQLPLVLPESCQESCHEFRPNADAGPSEAPQRKKTKVTSTKIGIRIAPLQSI